MPLVALVRWTAWAPATFYTQLLQSAVTCFAQAASSPSSRNAALWRAFVVGRVRAKWYCAGSKYCLTSICSYPTCYHYLKSRSTLTGPRKATGYA